MRRSRLASLAEGGGTAKAVTEGVSYHKKQHSPSQKIGSEKPIFASPLSEGAKGAAAPVLLSNCPLNNTLHEEKIWMLTKIWLPAMTG